ncbi:MAG TPA: hypothetical protein PLI43_19705 [Albidovulum sp.]|uniref:hypothetical protein n=1 Tax=Albidovulum sp. TaxID=1872424 RepID=UPI002B9A7158|nr:hypothetical protein [Albidovulum sp.]
MPDLARNRRTGTVHVAAELPFSPDLDRGGWECPGCRGEMIPVAASGDRLYKVAPHFRIHGQHAEHCSALLPGPGGGSTPSASGDAGNALPGTFPRKLRLAADRQDVVPEREPAAASAAHAGLPKAASLPHPQGSASVAGTLHRIAESYLLAPEYHGEPLEIEGCEGTSYETCFRRLKNTSRPARLPRLVWFAEIQFRHILREGDVAELTLSPLRWIKERGSVRPGPHYRIRFDMAPWTPRRRNAMFAELERRRVEQQELHHAEAAERVNIFFFGRQDGEDAMLFHVEDPRLACFFLLPKV